MAADREERQVHVPESWREVAACVDRYEDRAASGLPNLADLLEGVSDENRLQAMLELMLVDMLNDAPARQRWRANALAFAETADIYSNAERAADIILQGAA